MTLTPYTPDTQYIDPLPIPEANWTQNGVGIRRNNDFDSGSNTKDSLLGTATAAENDLIRLDIAIAATSGIEYRLKTSANSPAVRLWNSPLKGGYPLAVYTNNGALITDNSTVYAEYIGDNNSNTAVTFELEAIHTATGTKLFSHPITFRPFNSITVVFSGEGENPSNPNIGVNMWTTRQLLDGYDVHIWRDGHDWWYWDEADEWGRGPAYDAIVNAVNNHGQTKIALVGYSHGGGTVYNVAWRIANNYNDTHGHNMTVPHSLVFTSYIDAVSNSNFANWFEENRRPLGSLFHLGQYQTNALAINGGPLDDNQEADGDADSSEAEDTEGDGYDIDRTELGVNHYTEGGEDSIDSNSIVLDYLTVKFKQKIIR
jgi:hypothetical protein